MNPHAHAGHGGHTATEPETVHRWVVFGTDRIYLSHLSMFAMPEHAVQLIVEAEFFDGDGRPSTAYADDRGAHPRQRLYTLDPDVFVLSDILPTDSQPARRSSLTADLYRDHVEKDNPERARIARGLDVRITRVVYARRYDPDATPLGSLEYAVFGDGTETYLAHTITRPPDFDQILRVAVEGDLAGRADGLTLTIPDRQNTLAERLEENGRGVPATLHGPGGDAAVTVHPGVEFYRNADRDLQ